MGQLRQLFSRRRRYDELSETIREHLDEKVADLMDRGMTQKEAERTARREFGNVARVEERSREVWQWARIESIWSDSKYAARKLCKTPGFAIVALLSLALGIGATTSMFSLIYAVLLHPVPYHDWQRLAYPMMMNGDQPGWPVRWFSVTWSQYQQLLNAKCLADVSGIDTENSEITGNTIPEDVSVNYVTENISDFTGVPTLFGRNIQPSDANYTGQTPVVLSYELWMRHYGGDRNILGHILELAHKSYPIIGVMPKDFAWGSPWGSPGVYVPMSSIPASVRNVVPIMKLKPGTGLAVANAEIGALVHQFAKETPQYFPRQFKLHLEHISDRVLSAVGPALTLLIIAVVMLLLIGCANCSILLFARSIAREGEMAARAALGASRGRIVQQLLIEATVLAVAGSVLGIGLAHWMAKLIFGLFPDAFMHESEIHINLPILGFSVALAVISGLLFGLLPSLRMSRPDIAQVMKAMGRKVSGHTDQARSMNTLIAAQIALTTVLMGAAGAAIGGFLHMTQRNMGYEPAHVMSIPIPLHQHSYPTREARAAYFETLRQKIAEVPGVTNVAIAPNGVPPDSGSNLRFEIQGQPLGNQQYIRAHFISSAYFSTLHIPLLAGRTWDAGENARGAAVAVINETLARQYFPNRNAIGQQIRMPTLTLHVGDPGQLVGNPDVSGWVQIIGITADAANDGLNMPILPAVYVPYPRFMWMNTQFLVQTQGPPLAELHAVQIAIHSVNPDQQTSLNVLDLKDRIEQQPEFKQQRLFSILFSLFSGLALALALAGLYSVVSYSVAQRTNEFGIRMALGAQRAHVLWVLVRRVGVTVLTGLSGGVIAYLALHKLLAHWTQNSYSNSMVLCGVAALFIVCAALACAIPALSAITADPVQALRAE